MAVGWIEPKCSEENGFESEMYFCSEGKEFKCASSGNQIRGQFGPNRGGTLIEIHSQTPISLKELNEAYTNRFIKSQKLYTGLNLQ